MNFKRITLIFLALMIMIFTISIISANENIQSDDTLNSNTTPPNTDNTNINNQTTI